ncbi:hypothetical protein Peur_017579 [Populus x canadensis]
MEMGGLLAPLQEDNNPCLPGPLRLFHSQVFFFVFPLERDRLEENLISKDANGIQDTFLPSLCACRLLLISLHLQTASRKNSLKIECRRKYERDHLEGCNNHTVSLTVKKGIKDGKTSTWSQNPFIIFKSLPSTVRKNKCSR